MNNNRTVKGILGSKLGMTQLWDENNKIVPVTVIQAGPCVVTQVRTPEKDGYNAVQLAFGAVKPKNVNKPETGHFEAAGVTPRKHLVELRTADASEYTLGQEVTAETFEAGQVVAAVSEGDDVQTVRVEVEVFSADEAQTVAEVVAMVDARNSRSIAVTRRLGMRLAETLMTPAPHREAHCYRLSLRGDDGE